MADENINDNSHVEPNSEEPQPAMTTTTTTTTTANETTTNTINDFYTSSSPAPTLYTAARDIPATDIPSSIFLSLTTSTPTTTHQQPNPPLTLSDTTSDTRRLVSQLGNGLRALERYFGEDINRYGSLQTAERFRQVYALYAEVAHAVLSELDELDSVDGMAESEGVEETENARERGDHNGDDEEKENGMGERGSNGETRYET